MMVVLLSTHIFQGQYLVCLQCKLHLVSHKDYKSISKQHSDAAVRN